MLIFWLVQMLEISYLFMYIYYKSGIGSCIAPNTGFARHPVKGMCALFQMPYRALGPGVWWLVLPRTREQLGRPGCSAGEQRCRESKPHVLFCSVLFCYWGGGGGPPPPLVKYQTISRYFYRLRIPKEWKSVNKQLLRSASASGIWCLKIGEVSLPLPW